MPRVYRYRSRTSESYTGSRRDYATRDESQPGNIFYNTRSRASEIWDWHGRPVSAGTLDSTQRSGCMFADGYVISNGNRRTKFNQVPFIGQNGPGQSLNPLPAHNGWVLDLVAGTNPSRPVVTPPEMIENLVQLPRLLLDTWKVLRHPKTVLSPKGAANTFLGVKFGWMPMIKDILEVIDLQTNLNKRLKELSNLYSGKGLRRRLKFRSDTKFAEAFDQFSAQDSTVVNCFVSETYQYNTWGTIHWKPTSPPPYSPADGRYINHVRRVVLGLTPEGLAKGLWAVIPWTWLAGWFTNVGKLTLAFSNTVPARWSEACFMSSVILTSVPSRVTAPGSRELNISLSGRALRTRKTRIVGVYISVGANMPLWDMSKLSVLAALGIQRLMR